MSTRKTPLVFINGYWFRITGASKYKHKDKKMNFHSEYCHSVRQATNRLARLQARNARPRSIQRQMNRLEARRAVAEARRERRAEAVSTLQSVVQELVDQHFPPQE